MKRLILSVLLGAFCLAMLATLTHAGQYDPRNPPPTPYMNASDDTGTSDGEVGWDNPSQVAAANANQSELSAIQSESEYVIRVRLDTDSRRILSTSALKKMVLSVLLSRIFRW